MSFILLNFPVIFQITNFTVLRTYSTAEKDIIMQSTHGSLLEVKVYCTLKPCFLMKPFVTLFLPNLSMKMDGLVVIFSR